MHKSSQNFTWWHRDELQVLIVYQIVIFFFGRSPGLKAILVAGTVLPIAVFWAIRLRRRRGHDDWLIAWGLKYLPKLAWDRSRLFMSILSTMLVSALFVHRLTLFFGDVGSPIPPEQSFATPQDLYWILFLGWYMCVWLAITVFLFYKWKMHADPVAHRFWEGLVGSMYFYHGLPAKARIVTFAMAFFLGGLPTLYAVQIEDSDQAGMLTAALLIIPVALLILLGAWFASRWVGSTPSGEV